MAHAVPSPRRRRSRSTAWHADQPGLLRRDMTHPTTGVPPQALGPDVWNHQALLAALATTGVPLTSPQATEWFLDTGASSHMSSNASNFSSPQPLPFSPPITIGNGATLPVTHRASTAIATSQSPLHLHNVLVSPSLVKNLISVRSLTRDNNVSVEFDPFSFSVKDLPTRTEILRCNSHGELYPLSSSSPEAMLTTSPTVDMWHQRLDHLGKNTLRQTLCNLDFQFAKSSSSTCQACQLGKHVRLPFSSSNSVSLVPFQLVHTNV